MAKASSTRPVVVRGLRLSAAAVNNRKIAFYRSKADECQIMAVLAADQEARDQWLLLAKQWTYLALHSNPASMGAANLN